MIPFILLVLIAAVGILLVAWKPRQQDLGLGDETPSQARRRQRRRADGQTQINLEVLGKSEEEFQAERLLWTLLLGGVGVLPAVLSTFEILPVPIVFTLPAIPLGALLGWWLPKASVTTEAEKEHTEFTFAFGGYLTFVTMLLAGGMQQEPALRRAAEQGGGKHFATIRRTITQIESERQPIWHMFVRLAILHPTRTLDEIATSARMSQGRGADMADALTVKAEILRDEQRLFIRRAAEKASAAMQLPGLVFVFGPIGFTVVGVLRQMSSAAV